MEILLGLLVIGGIVKVLGAFAGSDEEQEDTWNDHRKDFLTDLRERDLGTYIEVKKGVEKRDGLR